MTLRLCLERIVPPPGERPVKFALPALKVAEDAIAAMAAITAAVAEGELSLGEAESVRWTPVVRQPEPSSKV